MTTVKTEQVTCDLCGAQEYQKAGEYAPEQWAKLHIARPPRYFDSYDICPMCMPPVEAEKRNRELDKHPAIPPERVQEVKDAVAKQLQDHADAGHRDPEDAAAEADWRGDPAKEPSDARSGA